MSIQESPPADMTAVSPNRPSDDQLDLFGITHRGKVRTKNEDHFLICTVHPQVVIHGTSLPNADALPLRGTRLATLMVVADGVGGAAAGNEAARLATEAITRYVSSTLRSYHAAGSATDEEFLAALRAAALEAHDAVLAESSARDDKRKMATTLTVAIAVWPWLYVTQVGDSRLYYHANGVLRQITRDQTVGQELVDQGVLPADKLHRSPLRNVLSRAIGSDEALPEVTLVDVSERSCTLVLCSDGLTKHVSDDDIAAALATPRSSEQVARELLDLALSRGGTDNITIVIASAPLKRASNPEQSGG
ncbi:MAG: protein phosphatase 2C domain-containing protein [Gemmatimonadales bacterium]